MVFPIAMATGPQKVNFMMVDLRYLERNKYATRTFIKLQLRCQFQFNRSHICTGKAVIIGNLFR